MKIASLSRMLPALLGGVLLLNACSPAGTFTPLSAEHPIAQLPEGLTLSANPASLTEGEFGVQMAAHPVDSAESDAVKAALDARPASATFAGPVFTLTAQGKLPEQLFISLNVPGGIEATLVDVYAWDGTAWHFLPSEARSGSRVATVTQLPGAVALFQTAPAAPLAMVRFDPQEVWSVSGATGEAVLLGGVQAQPDGSLGGVLPNLPAGANVRQYAVVTADLSRIGTLLAEEVRAAHVQTLADFAASGSFVGLALDYANLDAAQTDSFTEFVSDLHTRLRERNRALLIYLSLPGDAAYDWAALGANSDAVLARLPPDPRSLGNGEADRALSWATGQVERGKLRIVTSALPVAGGPNGLSLLPNANLADWNSVQTGAVPEPLLAGQPVTATLSNTMRFDSEAAALQVNASEGTIWFTSPLTLRQRFTLAEKYRLGGVVAQDVFSAREPAAMLTALDEYRASAAVPQPQTSVRWTVKDASGVIAQATAQPGSAYVFVASQPGEYQIAAEVQGVPLGAAPIKVAEAATPTATPAPTQRPVTGGGGNPNPGGATPIPQPTSPPSGGFIPPPPVVNTGFELGGQVPGGINHPAQMKQAGMRWVKFQVRGGGGDLIAAGKANGFKVLLSVIGDKSRVTDPNYWNEYAAWVGGLAAQGADAIEVWNEPNIDHEWPEGQIDGATYTQLLAKAYAAIKAANGGTIVISAGPAPTGAEAAFPGRVVNDDKFLRQMANAGAANYFDCVGTHYNEGIVSPKQTSGDPRDNFYSRYYGSMVDLYYNSFGGTRPICFTELGYLTGEGYGPLPSFFAWAQNTTLAQQAQWLAEAASLSAASGRVRLMTIWNVDFTLYGGDPQAGYAIVRADGSCPACAALDAVMP